MPRHGPGCAIAWPDEAAAPCKRARPNAQKLSELITSPFALVPSAHQVFWLIEFLTNLPASGAELRRRLIRAWGAREALTAWPRTEVMRLVAEKYAQEAWTRRR